ncbi:formylglycine-generating enzyme family protein [Methanolobus bombayensis]|uniref:formylglycine-generating enzyme family protein n=1 Tax=Methanolobus bombayensis TaxID=38023 RepID=UPI001AE5D436|nr:formylglycine-generating enzyme family protein [Methanolobus bombayensis]MBP1908393.1 formylglycine-generating enzyme required for sulfatase activity [Methanolobus bombayensis]
MVHCETANQIAKHNYSHNDEQKENEKINNGSIKAHENENVCEVCTNSIGTEFLLIPAGKFMMGSKKDSTSSPIHEVTISKPFYLGKYPVTQREWVLIMGSNPSFFKGHDNHPVEQVSWDDAQEFVSKLNSKEGTHKYRLPSEAEWEYACRAGTTSKYYFGDDESDLNDYGWYSGKTTHPVGQKKPNPWGLYDMNGNVWEWCEDKWHSNFEDAPADGSAWEYSPSSLRVDRGGCWSSLSRFCCSALRSANIANDPFGFTGFRLLREV